MIQPCLPPRVVQDVNVAHLHQLPSLFPGGFALFVYVQYMTISARLSGQHLLRVVDELVREVDRTRQVAALLVWPRECLHENEVVPDPSWPSAPPGLSP